MTPAGVLGRVLPRWRASLASRYSPGDLDSFIERNRAALESLVSQALLAWLRPMTSMRGGLAGSVGAKCDHEGYV